MRIIATLEVDEDEYKKAIVKGWYERYGEEITINEITSLEDGADFMYALPQLDFNPSDIEIEIEE